MKKFVYICYMCHRKEKEVDQLILQNGDLNYRKWLKASGLFICPICRHFIATQLCYGMKIEKGD